MKCEFCWTTIEDGDAKGDAIGLVNIEVDGDWVDVPTDAVEIFIHSDCFLKARRNYGNTGLLQVSSKT